jgi:hypothetical protein
MEWTTSGVTVCVLKVLPSSPKNSIKTLPSGNVWKSNPVEVVIPELVTESKAASGEEVKGVALASLTAVLVEAVKELSGQVKSLEKRVAELETARQD